jgi:hypothetical protein
MMKHFRPLGRDAPAVYRVKLHPNFNQIALAVLSGFKEIARGVES